MLLGSEARREFPRFETGLEDFDCYGRASFQCARGVNFGKSTFSQAGIDYIPTDQFARRQIGRELRRERGRYRASMRSAKMM